MNLDTTKEEILQFKWTLNQIVKNKTEAATAQNWEAAAGFRDEEKVISEYLKTLENEIQQELSMLKQPPLENKNNIILLEELLLLIESDAKI
ncbi:MAG: hypothetical protein NT127_08945 [Sphingobacteriales bacterium]|nr:hypothetical protein [Sphingobacteriales bacterium]